MISLPLIIFFCYLMVPAHPDLRLSVPEWIGLCAIVTILLSVGLYLNQSLPGHWSAGFIITLAAIFRMMFIWRSPELSDDIYRYLFDGLMFLSGHNPYAAAPADVPAGILHVSDLIQFINHPELPTIYPPAAQFVFAAGAILSTISGMKLILVIMDLLTCVLIIKLLGKFQIPIVCAALYAWHPLPVIEIAASGHIDSAAIFFLFLSFAVNNHTRIRGFFAGVFFAAAVLSKWVPLIFLPGMWILTKPDKRKYAAFGFIITCTAMIGVFWPDVLNSFHTLSVYAVNWEFSGFAFRWLRVITGSGAITRSILAAAFIIITIMIYIRWINAALLQRTPALEIPLNPPLAKGDFPSPLFQRGDLDSIPNGYKIIFKGFYATAMSFLFLTPTLHPWYALYLASFLPFATGPAGIAFSWSVFLAYRVVILYGLTGQWVENDFIPFLIVSAPAAAFAASVIIGKAKRKGAYPAKNFH
jgi:hypothetical protein